MAEKLAEGMAPVVAGAELRWARLDTMVEVEAERVAMFTVQF
jgi:hypothetical protein